ncbi:MAG: hypothetical protein AB7T31_13225 [Gemmatimonadales bacterium]
MSAPRVASWALICLAASGVGACGGTTPPPEPGTIRGVAPDLRGTRVVILPVQQNFGVPGDLDAELAYGLRERSAEVAWISTSDVDQVLARSPAMQTRTRGLPVGAFVQAEVQRIGDPLFGELRRIAALVDAQAVVLPVQATLESAPGEDPRVRLWAALIDVRTGRVPWFAVLEGQPFPPGDPRALVSAVDALAGSLLWYAVR